MRELRNALVVWFDESAPYMNIAITCVEWGAEEFGATFHEVKNSIISNVLITTLYVGNIHVPTVKSFTNLL